MISLLTAFFLYHADAEWYWWAAWGVAFWWNIILTAIVSIVSAAK